MYATVEDVKGRWLVDEELTVPDAKIQNILDDAESLVNDRFPTLQQAVAHDRVQGTTPRRIVTRMVIRMLLNPSGRRSFNQTSGPHSVQETHGGDNPGEPVLTDDEADDLRSLLSTKIRAYPTTVSMLPVAYR